MIRWKLVRRCLALPALAALAASGFAEDWPTYMRDAARSGISSESLTTPLEPIWTYRSAQPPIAAWEGPAKWDGWHKVYNLKNRVDFDKALQVVCVAGRVYFGSSVDDKLYCVDAQTGRTLWVFYTEGPIRLAPSISEGRVYFGSDDGFVYCLGAQEGELIWKTHPGPRDRRLPGNGRIISMYAIRTNVLPYDGKVYCGAGVIPSQTVYIYELDALTGETAWHTPMNDLPAQGYLMASASKLYLTTGRGSPVILDRASGEHRQTIGGASGTFALLTGDTLVYGGARDGRALNAYGAQAHDQLASFRGNHMIVREGKSYLHTDTNLAALDRDRYIKLMKQRKEATARRDELKKKEKLLGDQANQGEVEKIKSELAFIGERIGALGQQLAECTIWEKACKFPYSLILSGDKIFAGGPGKVAAFSADSGEQIWTAEVDGNAYGLAIADGKLFVSTDTGSIHCFEAQ